MHVIRYHNVKLVLITVVVMLHTLLYLGHCYKMYMQQKLE